MADRYGWQREELLVFGDGGQRRPDAVLGGHSVALFGNGTPAAKAAAGYVTTPRGERTACRTPSSI